MRKKERERCLKMFDFYYLRNVSDFDDLGA